MALYQLDDDTLICICSFLPVPSILRLRQTCKRLAVISRLHYIWQIAYIDQILGEGYPFPSRALATANASQLERLVIRALRLGAFWLSPSVDLVPAHIIEFQASTGTGVSNVRFLGGHGGRYILTVYKGIWSMVSCWDVGSGSLARTRKVADWCPKNTIFSGFVTNSDPDSEGALAVAVQHGSGTRTIEILSIFRKDDTEPSFQSVCNIATAFRPIALKGDFIAFSDDASETVIMNWRENTFALLKGSQIPVDERFQYNRCLQAVFVHKSILVVRARSVELFPEPDLTPADGESEYSTYHPIGLHTFGWIDGVSVNTQTSPRVNANGKFYPSDYEPLSIIIRAESDDPWASGVHKLEQFVLHPNPVFGEAISSSPSSTGVPDTEGNTHTPCRSPSPPPAPYLFPPVRAEQTSPTVRGFLRCRDIVLGPAGTALWIQPRAARTAHLTGYDVHSSATQISVSVDVNPDFHHFPHIFAGELSGTGTGIGTESASCESLCAAVFEGPLQRRHPELRMGREPRARTLWMLPERKEGCDWTAFDYEEDVGRVALGSSDGSVTVLDLV